MLMGVQRMNNFNKITFAKNKKYEYGGWLEVKINILFNGDNS
jgi:hypothetical protein